MANPDLGVDIRLTAAANWLDPESGGMVLTDTGDLARIGGVDNVDQALRLRLNTRKGGLWAHPQYGNPVFDIVSELMSDEWYAQAVAALKECINDEPRAECVDVSYTSTPNERRAEFTVRYRVAGGRQGNLVWGFSADGEAVGDV